jgi:tetratricopeptide (TPR) repeat protein
MAAGLKDRRRVVMISSTARDLPEHRDAIRIGCERAGFEPRMMEHLPALDADAIKASLAMVDAADVYVGVFAYRYGYVPDGHDVSVTEMEYDRAVALNKPRLIFFIHEDHPVTGKDVETGSGAAKLETFKSRIGKARVAAFFKSAAELRAHVVEALTTLAKELDEAEAGDAAASAAAKLHRRTSIPAPPEPYVAHPYTLLQSRDLVGRQAELNALTDWVAKPGSPAFDARVFCFVAIGGMGKSALAWKWFTRIAPEEMKPLAGRMWWSFYESDATFENFLIRALCYVSGQDEDEVRRLPWPEREAQLLQYLSEQPYLLVLDGFERILLAYHRMDASYLADDEYDQKTANVVAGAAGLPATAAQSFVGQHRLRQTTDLRAGAFLQKLAQVAKSRILITTRLYPSALQLPTSHPRPGCSALFLRGLSDDDALGLWRALGVSGSRTELVPIFRSVEGHPLLMQALASEIANYRKAPGDFARWRADHPQFDPTSLPLVQSRTHILEFALKGLSSKIREVLHTLVGFRMPVSYATLEALLVGKIKACVSAQELDRALMELEDRGLIGWDREANRYDAHPIVRGVVWQFTDPKDRRAVYTAIEAHFESMATPEWDKVETLNDLTPAIELYHTLVDLGRYDDALIIFRRRLEYATFARLAAYRERITWLERLLPESLESSPVLTRGSDVAWMFNALAGSYRLSGQPGQAATLLRRAGEIYGQGKNREYQGITASNLSHILLEIGALHEAAGTYRQTLALAFHGESQDTIRESSADNKIILYNHLDSARRSNIYYWDPSLIEIFLLYFGRLLNVIGDYYTGGVALKKSWQRFESGGNLRWKGLAIIYIVERLLWLNEFVKADALANTAWELVASERRILDFVHTAFLQGRAALGRGEFARADDRLHHALAQARAANGTEHELPILIALAELELQRGRPSQARTRLDEVWEAAERGPYRLRQADAYNVLAAIARAEGDEPAAIDAATKAYTAAWCDGPPYAYHWGLQKAKAHLAALGAPEPVLPPFDESKFEPLPEVEINPRDEYWVDPDKLDDGLPDADPRTA